ncbi:MAG: chromosome segregation protein SMC, partial [Planctomycetes bacterium]|nr:chromosome segregation protein SMC [Planctomycetota bacterium]
ANLVREMRLALALEEFARLSVDLTEAMQTVDALKSGGAEIAARLGTLEAALSAADLELVGLEERIRAAADEKGAAQSARDLAEDRGRTAATRLAELDLQEQEDRTLLDGVDGRIAALDAERKRAEADLALATAAAAGEGDSEGAQAMRAKRAELDGCLAAVDALVALVEDAKAKQVECMRELARIEAEQGRLENARHALADRRQRTEDRSGGSNGQLMAAIGAETQARQALDDSLRSAADAHTRLDERIRAREEAQAEANRLEQELGDLRHNEARIETGLRLHQEAERRAEGVSRGVRDVLAEMDRMPGIIGMVAELCRVPEQYVTAIEVALGQQAQNIIAETQAAAKDAIEFLKREKRGRATFLPLDDIRGRERVDGNLLREPGVVDVASRLVDYEPRFREAFDYLLGNILVVETLDHAIALRRRQRVGCRLVTLDGEVVNAGGAMTGGRAAGGHEGGGVVSRRNEIGRLGDQLAELTQRKAELAQKRDEARKRGIELSLGVEEARRAIKEGDHQVGEAKANLMKTERDRLHLESNASGFGAELEEIAAEMGKLEAEGRDLAGQHEWFTALERKLVGDIEGLQGQTAAKAALRDKVQEEVANLRVTLATSHERVEASRNHLAHLTRAQQELEDQREERGRRLAGIDAKRAELREAVAANGAAREREAVRFDAAAEALDTLIKERDRRRDEHEEARQEARVLQARAKVTDQERGEAELKANEARLRIESLSTRIMDDHQIVLAEAFTNYVRPEDLDLPSLRERLTASEREMAQLGPVNLAAIDELEEAQEREKFLDQQFTDLTNAKTKLEEVIADLNQVSGMRFEETYREVRRNFQELFRKLFGGGRADLQLELKDEEGNPLDPLEAGLEIMACPPGKNPKIITQLSGGEKALTAIALVFAVYKTKPSPFCILDEVDAPLDEANVDRYIDMVREFTQGTEDRPGSQFIVITHRKRTMMRADALYGITQNEPGVSTKISVRFSEVEGHFGKDGELLPTVKGSGPFTG